MRSIVIAALAAASYLLAPPCASHAKPGPAASHLGRTVAQWQADLASDSAQARFDGLVALAKIGPDARTALADVERLMRDPHQQVRERAIGTLAALGGDGYAAILRGLQSKDTTTRALCCDVLTFSDPPRRKTREALIGVLDDEVPTVRYLAAFALTAVAPNALEVLPVLREALKTTNAAAVTGACHAVARMRFEGKPLLQPVLGVFQVTSETALTAAAAALRAMGPAIAGDVLRQLTRIRGHPTGQAVLLGVLADLGSRDARIPAGIARLLASPSRRVAEAAAIALSRADSLPPDARGALIRAIDRIDGVSARALQALVKQGPLGQAAFDAVLMRVVAEAGVASLPSVLAGAELPAALWTRWRARLDAERDDAARSRLIGLLVESARANDKALGPTLASVVVAALDAGGPLERAAAIKAVARCADGPQFATGVIVNLRNGNVPEPFDTRAAVTFADAAMRHLEDPDPWHTADARARDPGRIMFWNEWLGALAPLLEAAAKGSHASSSETARVALLYVRAADPAAHAGCIDVLASSNMARRRMAAAALATVEPGTPAVVTALKQVISHEAESPVVRRTAAVALARQGTAASALIVERIKGSTGAVRRFWLVAWGRAGTRGAALMEHVYEDLGSTDASIREAAIEGFAAMGSHRTVAAKEIARMLTRRDPSARETALEALSALGSAGAPYAQRLVELVIAMPRGARAKGGRLVAEMGPSAVPGIADALLEAPWESRLVALNILARIGPEATAAVPAVVRALADSDSSVREAALGVLERIGTGRSEAVDAIRGRLGDPVGRVRAAACRALAVAHTGDPKSQEALTALASGDRFAFVRKAAAETLKAWR